MTLAIGQTISTFFGRSKNKIKILGKIQKIEVSRCVYATEVDKPWLYVSQPLKTPQIVCVVLWSDGREVSYTGEQMMNFMKGGSDEN